MNRWIELLKPDEWICAARCYGQMFVTARLTRHGIAKLLWTNLLAYGIGHGLAYVITLDLREGYVQAIAAAAGVFIGVLASQMVFTGAMPPREGLPLEILREYANKMRFLMLSQTITIVALLATVAACVLWLSRDPLTVPAVQTKHLYLPLIMGTACWALIRTLLLPAQIYEVHAFAQDQAIHAEEEEMTRRVEAKRRSIDLESEAPASKSVKVRRY